MKDKLLMFAVIVTSVVGLGAGSAFATTPPDEQIGDAMASASTDVQDFVVGVALPIVLGLVVVGILIRLGIKWTRRAGKAIG